MIKLYIGSSGAGKTYFLQSILREKLNKENGKIYLCSGRDGIWNLNTHDREWDDESFQNKRFIRDFFFRVKTYDLSKEDCIVFDSTELFLGDKFDKMLPEIMELARTTEVHIVMLDFMDFTQNGSSLLLKADEIYLFQMEEVLLRDLVQLFKFSELIFHMHEKMYGDSQRFCCRMIRENNTLLLQDVF